jgi:hypothetical protein
MIKGETNERLNEEQKSLDGSSDSDRDCLGHVVWTTSTRSTIIKIEGGFMSPFFLTTLSFKNFGKYI